MTLQYPVWELGRGPGLTSVITTPVTIKATSLATDTCQDKATLQRQKWYAILNTEEELPKQCLPKYRMTLHNAALHGIPIKRVSPLKSSLIIRQVDYCSMYRTWKKPYFRNCMCVWQKF